MEQNKTEIRPFGPGGYEHSVQCWLCNERPAVYDAYPNWHFIPCCGCQESHTGIWTPKKKWWEKLFKLFIRERSMPRQEVIQRGDSTIHILYGTGTNCTCYDCFDLYGGECATTRDNDFLDALEEKVIQYLELTPTGRKRVTSDSYMDKCINDVVSPAVRKELKIKTTVFDKQYYSFMPLLFLMTSERKKANRWYRRSRNWIYSDIKDKLINLSSEKV